jgi:hypothetical protein
MPDLMLSRHGRACLMSEGGVEEYNYFIGGTTHLLDVLDTLDRTEHAVLIIEGMNAWWYHTLATRYHNSLDVKFLAQHVLRLGELEVKYETRGNLGVEFRAPGSQRTIVAVTWMFTSIHLPRSISMLRVR